MASEVVAVASAARVRAAWLSMAGFGAAGLILAVAACSAGSGPGAGHTFAGHAGAGHAGAGQGRGQPSATGTVVGRFVREGGPIRLGGKQPLTVRLPGTVQFVSPHGRRVSVVTGKSGTFSLKLPPGTYRVAGRTPRLPGPGGGRGRETPCSQPLSVTVACVVP